MSVSLAEIRRSWSVRDVFAANDALDLRSETDRRYSEWLEAQRPK